MSNITNCILLLVVLSLPVLAMENIDNFPKETIKLVSHENNQFSCAVFRQNIFDLFGDEFTQYILSDVKKILDLPDRIVKIIANIISCTDVNDLKELNKIDKKTFIKVMHFFRDNSSSEIGEYLPVELFALPPKEDITATYVLNRLKFAIRYKIIKP